MLSAGLRVLLRHLEIWLSPAGVAVILLVPMSFADGAYRWWQIAAVTAIVVGVIHGMLKHLINNPLCTISMSTGLMASEPRNRFTEGSAPGR